MNFMHRVLTKTLEHKSTPGGDMEIGHIRDCTWLEIIKRGEIDGCFVVALSLFASLNFGLNCYLVYLQSIVSSNHISQLDLNLSR